MTIYIYIYIYLHIYILYIYIYIYTPGKKYKTSIKNEEKDIVYNFLIMKIRYMKDKVWRQIQNKKKFQFISYMYISIHAQF